MRLLWCCWCWWCSECPTINPILFTLITNKMAINSIINFLIDNKFSVVSFIEFIAIFRCWPIIIISLSRSWYNNHANNEQKLVSHSSIHLIHCVIVVCHFLKIKNTQNWKYPVFVFHFFSLLSVHSPVNAKSLCKISIYFNSCIYSLIAKCICSNHFE